MVFLISQFMFILFVLIGIIIWASSDRPLALREIAINSRRDHDEGSAYTMLKVLSVCLKILAVLFWVIGIAIVIGMNIAGNALGSLLPASPSL
jgi:hypothetical protein